MTRANTRRARERKSTGIGWSLLLSVPLLALVVAPAIAAPKADPWPFWAANDPAGQAHVDHTPWGRLLREYVETNHPSGINRVRYASVTPDDRKSLDAYLLHLQQVEVTRLSLSSIYDWFQPDFGGSEESVVRHLRKYADPGLAGKLKGFKGKISYEYDWRINEP